MQTENALSEYCMYSDTALQLLAFCTACLSSLTEAEAEPEMLLHVETVGLTTRPPICGHVGVI